jgi:hypothetical protein
MSAFLVLLFKVRGFSFGLFAYSEKLHFPRALIKSVYPYNQAAIFLFDDAQQMRAG